MLFRFRSLPRVLQARPEVAERRSFPCRIPNTLQNRQRRTVSLHRLVWLGQRLVRPAGVCINRTALSDVRKHIFRGRRRSRLVCSPLRCGEGRLRLVAQNDRQRESLGVAFQSGRRAPQPVERDAQVAEAATLQVPVFQLIPGHRDHQAVLRARSRVIVRRG